MKWLKYYREKSGFSMEELSNIVEVRLNTIWRWENDKASPSVEIIGKIANALHVTVDELLNGPRDGKIELVVSWNWEDYKKGEINMFDEKFLMVLGTDGRVGLQGDGTVTNKATLEEFVGRVREQLEIALDAQIRRGVVVQEA